MPQILAVATAVGSVVGGAVSALGGLAAAGVSALGGLAGSAASALGGAASTVGGLAVKGISTAGGLAGGVVSTAGKAVAGTVSTAGQVASGLTGGVTTIVDLLTSERVAAIGGLVNLFRSPQEQSTAPAVGVSLPAISRITSGSFPLSTLANQQQAAPQILTMPTAAQQTQTNMLPIILLAGGLILFLIFWKR